MCDGAGQSLGKAVTPTCNLNTDGRYKMNGYEISDFILSWRPGGEKKKKDDWTTARGGGERKLRL